MLEKTYFTQFDNALTGRPYMIFPNVFGDNRGTFSEVMKDDDLLDIKQINRSTSCKMAFRGFHAQKAPFCQSKLVEALTYPIYDIIVDARPDSKSFGLCEAFLLDPKKQNKLYVPRGFLHAFFVPDYEGENDAIFMYYCDNVYNKASEIGVNPKSVLAELKEKIQFDEENKDILHSIQKMIEDSSNLVLSEKDLAGIEYKQFMQDIALEYKETKKLWFEAGNN